ncbi:Type 1 glutamine amidotransferase-like domain-containing protein [Acidiferrimicrobium sp. IK]|uniref:Type 1 glutamine amidotransferase-like domain-containing protein n=1 Tax=Acidiferrimicrobium sp. IK TaxID=2871700 RepID=UPI0021CB63FA|nr:Type 1 glutamine amidotransferase-like domain-containing protein [Acidiferrimicrobium sp. IK]MCU4186169.1 Type 1 glutamine amidotransferase-like domain-containing protein [Acidiferrimicrobium sp. IK]
MTDHTAPDQHPAMVGHDRPLTETGDPPSTPPNATGPLALVGGGEWQPGCDFDADLWADAGRPEVVVLPTAAAYEHPQRAVDTAARWFAGFGAKVSPCMLLGRADASDPKLVEQIKDARMIYLAGGSPLHLRSVLKDSPAWSALRTAWESGATVVGSSAGAMVLCDPMIDPRGGALTLGLGLVRHLAVLPHAASWSPSRAQRTFDLATGHLRIAAIDERTALVLDPGGHWRSAGAGEVTVYVDGRRSGLDSLT